LEWFFRSGLRRGLAGRPRPFSFHLTGFHGTGPVVDPKAIVQAVACWLLVLAPGTTTVALAAEDDGRCVLWVDVYQGEPVSYESVLGDLKGVRVVYLGECHALERHHAIQLEILRDLDAGGLPLVLGLEQLEHFQQPDLDRYNEGKIDYAELAKATNWSERWRDYQQYRPILEAARELRIPVVALNARAETIRQVARGGGVDRLDAQARNELPSDLQLEDPVYEKLLNLELSPEEEAMARDIEITHEQLRAVNRPVADYLHVKSLTLPGRSD